MIQEAEHPCDYMGRSNRVKWGFLKEKRAFVVCLSHGTGVFFQVCVMSQICHCRSWAWVVAAAWVLGCVCN